MSNRRYLASLLALALPLAVAQATDIGYVDAQQVFEKSKVGSKAQEQVKELELKVKPILLEKQAIEQDRIALVKEGALMSKDQMEKKQAEIKKRIESFQKVAAPLEEEEQKVQQDVRRALLAPTQKASEAVAKQKKLGMVIERSQAGVVFIDKSLDITDEVIKQMDANTK